MHKLYYCLVCILRLPDNDKLARGIDRRCLVCPNLLCMLWSCKDLRAQRQPAVGLKLFEINNWGRSPWCQAEADIFQHLSHVWALSPCADLIHSMRTNSAQSVESRSSRIAVDRNEQDRAVRLNALMLWHFIFFNDVIKMYSSCNA